MGMCDGCHSGCCRAFAVPITGADVIRLERDTGRTFWDFACRWEDRSGAIAARYAPHLFFADEPETPFVLCLKQEDSQNFPGTGRCSFLKEQPATAERPLGTATCGVHSSRPAACRAFPTRFDLDSDLPVIHPVPEYGRPGQSPAYRLCPRQWTPADIDPLEMTHDLVVARYEGQFFRQIAEVWNRLGEDWDIFPDFLRDVYAHRILPMSATAAAKPQVAAAGTDPIVSDDTDTERHILKMPRPGQEKRSAA